MATYNFIGWCNEDKHDKVWVCIQLNGDKWGGRFATVWGRRGKKLQYKIIDYSSTWDMEKLVNSKHKKGYAKIFEEDLNRVYPEFETDLKQIEFFATLSI